MRSKALVSGYFMVNDSSLITDLKKLATLRILSAGWQGALAVLILALAYGYSLMRDISGGNSAYTVDSGEFQVALPLWGTLHHTGYPLYALLGSSLVTVLRWGGVPPAAGVSLFSLVWQALAIGLLVWLIKQMTGQGRLALAGGLFIGLTRSIWLHGAIPEVYSLGVFLLIAMIAVAYSLRQRWQDRLAYGLAFLAGLGIAHHRLMVVALPAVGYLLWPALPRGRPLWRFLTRALAVGAMGFLPYLDMVWRARRGATWTYGSPGTWQGFWWIFSGKEVEGLQRPAMSLADLVAGLRHVVQVQLNELWPASLALALLATAVALREPSTRPHARFWLALAACYWTFGVFFEQAVLMEAVLMPATIGLATAALVGLGTVSTWYPRLRGAIVLALLAGAVFLFLANRPGVIAITQNSRMRHYIQEVSEAKLPPNVVVMAPWGSSFFALAYAQRLEGRMAQWNIVDHRASFAELASVTTGRIYTASDTLFVFNADWWASRLGMPLRITSAGPGLIALSGQPLEASPDQIIPIGDGLALVSWDVQPPDSNGQTDIILYWTATHTPTKDYSTFVHITDQNAISTPEDLMAQSDYASPVYGWYPTSHWQPNEVVREDHLVPLPPDRTAVTIFAGMYSRDANGNFTRLGQVPLRNFGGEWIVRP